MKGPRSLRQLASRIVGSLRADRFKPVYEDNAALQNFLGATNGQRPKFLFDATSLSTAERVSPASFQRWVSLACSDATVMKDSGLAIYDVIAPPLRPGFPWDWSPPGEAEDILYQARPHRFAFAPRLAIAIIGNGYSSTDFAALLRDWMNFARRKPKLAFISTFVVLQRLVASTCAFHLLPATDAADANELRASLLKIIHEDVRFLIPRIGDSYPNGHLLTDRFAGWFITAVHPEFCDGKLNREQMERLWVAELERQTYEDGGSFEHSMYYHGLATELGVLYWLVKRRNGEALASGCERRICELLRFQADLAGPDGNAPALGDAADDPMFALGTGSATTPAMLREAYRRLTGARIPPLAAEHPGHERAFWLLAAEAFVEPQEHASRSFSPNPMTGVFSFFEHDEATRLILRSGPAPDVATMSGHMHADIMSICLISRGKPVLVDPGTYSYRFKPPQASSEPATNWREYLMGPHAHNGIVIGDHDPLGAVTGDFRSDACRARVRNNSIIEADELTWVESETLSPEQYADTVRGVIHVKGEYFVVYNVLARGANPARVIFPLQLDARAPIKRERDNVIELDVAGEETSTIVYSEEIAVAERNTGRANPPSGWISPAYGVLRPALQLLFRPAGGNRASAFVFCLNATPTRITSRLEAGSSRSLAFELAGADFTDWVLINASSSGKAMSHAGIEFTGGLLWLRKSESGHGELRALGCSACSAPSLGLEHASDALERNVSLRWRLP